MTIKQDETTALCPPRHYKGIEFINYSDLSQEELVLLRKVKEQDISTNNIKQISFETVSIMIDGKIVHGCILYKDYLQWRENNYRSERLT